MIDFCAFRLAGHTHFAGGTTEAQREREAAGPWCPQVTLLKLSAFRACSGPDTPFPERFSQLLPAHVSHPNQLPEYPWDQTRP